MGQRKVIENYYSDVNNLADMLQKLVNSYRLLIGGANELNGIAMAHKGDVRDALKRVDKLGEIIDNILEVIESSSFSYLDYCKVKADIIKSHIEADYIQTEIETELKLTEK